ncbi:hypothetical protein TYRP_018119 [Tyrophagus putrescentiae]|nr:hypothetical protein TYRP_018119 [Tyrophagus putrescentiae]
MATDTPPYPTNGKVMKTPIPNSGKRHSRAAITANAHHERLRKLARENLLPLTTFAAVLGAILLGIVVRGTTPTWTARQLMYLEFPGEMFLRALKCLTIPLIVSSLVSAVGNLDMKLSGQIGKRALVYYASTTVIAISLGIFLVLTLHPGSASTGDKTRKDDGPALTRNITTEDTILDLVRRPRVALRPTDLHEWNIKIGEVGGTNVLGMVVISILLGVFVGGLQRDSKPLLLTLFNDMSELTLRLTGYVIQATPIGVAFLIMPRIIAVEDAGAMFRSVGFFTLTIILGLLIHGFIILPGIYYTITRKNPYKFTMGMSEALLTAFGTASSTATLPASINCLEKKNKVNRNVVRFVVPIGATINMDGTALYEAVAAIFIAQSTPGYSMDFVKVVIVSITSTAASVGAAGIPQAGLITMVIVLNALGLPPENIGLVFIIDWLVDRFRTAINVLGDAYGSAVVEHLSQADLAAFGALEAAARKPNEPEPEEIVLTMSSPVRTTPTLTTTTTTSASAQDNPAFDGGLDSENEKL